ncbi:MAG: cytochrome c3 family protein [Polyangiales bacterium]
MAWTTAGRSTPPVDAAVDAAASDAGSDAGWPALPTPLGLLPEADLAARSFSDEPDLRDVPPRPGAGSLEDASGRDVSQYTLWRSSVMALSARDPYFLAALSHEIEEHPEATDTIEATCTRCHAPAANEGLRASGAHPGLASLTTGVDSAANTARDGVTCTVCHQIEPTNLGTEASFSGGWMIGAGDVAYGPHTAPFEMNMVNATGYRPAFGAHVSESESCATCHTLFTRALDATGTPSGPSFPEQVPYLEWLASDYAVGGSREASRQSCHVPTTDVDGRVISTPISSRPNRLAARSPYGRHVFTGANGYLLELFAANESWANTEVPAVELLASATASDAMLGRAASLAATTRRDGDRVVLEVDVTNERRQLPTGYPSRRVFLRVEALDAAGAVVWASGRTNARGYLVDEGGRAIDGFYVVLLSTAT